jgi:glycosyltransferase involved in cell wall biosynthesis
MPLPTEGIRVLGRISEEQKEDGLAGALAAVVPSRYESLSLLTLEAFAQGTPVLAREDSAVLRGQVRRSRAGALFSDAQSFQVGVESLAGERKVLGEQARAFAAKHSWARVVSTYRTAMGAIQEKRL